MLSGSTSLEKVGKHGQVKGWRAQQCHGNGNMGSISGDEHASGPHSLDSPVVRGWEGGALMFPN
jgi:hypothetical protein